jgi:hypothetical protein
MALVDVPEFWNIYTIRPAVVVVVRIFGDGRHETPDSDLKDVIHQVRTQHSG